MVATVDLLAREMSETFHDMRSRLHGMSEDEFFWMPAPGSWTAFRDDPSRCAPRRRDRRSATSSA